MLTEVDVTSREFKKGIRGYNIDEVDIFKEEVVQTIEKLTSENRSIRDKVKNLEDRAQGYVTMEANLQEALLLAQKVANETKENAYKESDLIRKEAEMNAMNIIRDAKDKAYKAEQKYEMLKQGHDEFKLNIEEFYRTELTKLKNK